MKRLFPSSPSYDFTNHSNAFTQPPTVLSRSPSVDDIVLLNGAILGSFSCSLPFYVILLLLFSSAFLVLRFLLDMYMASMLRDKANN